MKNLTAFVFILCMIALVGIVGWYFNNRAEQDAKVVVDTSERYKVTVAHISDNTVSISVLDVKMARMLNFICTTGDIPRCNPDGTLK